MAIAVFSRKGDVRDLEKETVGERLRKARKARGWQQDQLAERVGAGDQTNISQWETGKREPSIANLIALVATLGINGHWLLTGKGDMCLEAASTKEHRYDWIELAMSGALDERSVGEVGGAETQVTKATPEPRREEADVEPTEEKG